MSYEFPFRCSPTWFTSANIRFVKACDRILASEFDDTWTECRPKWEDGTPAHTRKIFWYHERYCLYPTIVKKYGFPIQTLRPINWKAALDEILWIYQKCSNNIHDLHSHIWDSWADETGSIGKAYGYQIGLKTKYPDGEFNQMERVIHDLRTNPNSRSIMTMMYNPQDLPEMHLRPCCHGVNYNVTYLKKTGEKVLNAVVFQRSQDMLTANNWNLVQYSLLLLMVAHVTGCVPGMLDHVITDAHIYDRHEPLVRTLIDVYNKQSLPEQPTEIWVDPAVKEFTDFKVDSIYIHDYNPINPDIGKIPVAI